MLTKQTSAQLPGPANQKNTLGRTPLHYAAAAGRGDLVTIFCEEYRADIDARDNHGYTPLLRAMEADQLDVIDYLLLRGSRVTGLVNHEGNSALHLLVQTLSKEPDSRKLDIFHRFIEQGLDINAANLKGRRPLWLAIASDNILFVKALVEQGADVSMASIEETERLLAPFQLAERLGFDKIANFLALNRQASVAGAFYQPLSSQHIDPMSCSEKSSSELDSTDDTHQNASQATGASSSTAFVASTSQVTFVVAAYQYTAPRHDVLSLTVGELIAVLRQLSPEWAEGINSAGQRGVFPVPYTVPCTVPVIPHPPPQLS